MREGRLVALVVFLLAGCDCGEVKDSTDGGPSPFVDAGGPDAAPCDSGEWPDSVPCYEGPAGTAGVGVCVAGYRSCRKGSLTACIGQVLPRDEVCNGVDDNCDGTVDEGVAGLCGGCGDLASLCVGIDCHEDFEADDGSADGIRVDDDGALVLDGSLPVGEYRHIFAACDYGCQGWGCFGWDADVPVGAGLSIDYRAAGSVEELGDAAWVPIAEVPPDSSPAELTPEGTYLDWLMLEVRIVLRPNDSGAGPRLRSIEAEGGCSAIFC